MDVNGVGFCCYVSNNTLSYVNKGDECKLYTYCNIKEDTFDIYGFYTLSEKKSFELLIGVSGVGPKMALSILSVCSPDDLNTAILTENDKILLQASGVGKKLAQRIILELKDKTKDSVSLGISVEPNKNISGDLSKFNEASAALSALGYSTSEITSALRKVDINGLSVEDIVRTVLRTMIN